MRRTTGQRFWVNIYPGLLCGCNGYCSSTWPWSTHLRRRHQLYFHADISVADNKVKQLLVCVEEISHWMNGNRLKINKDKSQFVWLGTPHQLSRIRCQKITYGEADIQISTEAMCLGVLLDSWLTFAPHIRRISGRCFTISGS